MSADPPGLAVPVLRVLVADDHPVVRDGLRGMFAGDPQFEVLGEAGTGAEAVVVAEAVGPDVVLMDINLPRLSGTLAVRELKRCLPQTQFIMLTIEDDGQRVFESLQAGASGYLVKNVPPDKILAAIEEVHRGGSPMSSQIARMLVQTFQSAGPSGERAEKLTMRENEILNLVSRGYRSKEVSDELRISVQTVHTHLRNIYEKLHVRSRAEAVARYLGR